MANHIDFLRRQAEGQTVRAAAQGNTLAVVVTDQEIICGSAGLFQRFGNRVERYPLARLGEVTVLPNPSASMMQLRFVQPEEEIFILFPSTAQAQLDALVGTLREATNGVGR